MHISPPPSKAVDDSETESDVEPPTLVLPCSRPPKTRKTSSATVDSRGKVNPSKSHSRAYRFPSLCRSKRALHATAKEETSEAPAITLSSLELEETQIDFERVSSEEATKSEAAKEAKA